MVVISALPSWIGLRFLLRRPRNLSWLGQVILRRDRFIAEQSSGTRRFDLINAMIEARGFRTYLEIGVRNPSDCFDRVRVERKWSVDPGFEVESNPATFPMTSDEFFERLGGGQLKDAPARWDAIFIDGAHRAEQVWRDIQNALRHLSPGGVVFLHDCLPPSEPFAREQYLWSLESGGCWSGTSWKSFARYLETGEHAAWVVPTDWGVGVIDTARSSRAQLKHGSNPFFEYDLFVEQLKASGRIVQPASFLADCCKR